MSEAARGESMRKDVEGTFYFGEGCAGLVGIGSFGGVVWDQ